MNTFKKILLVIFIIVVIGAIWRSTIEPITTAITKNPNTFWINAGVVTFLLFVLLVLIVLFVMWVTDFKKKV
jgi:flagellar biosynthesis protein FlhB